MTKNVNDFITMNPECKIKLLKETAMDLIWYGVNIKSELYHR
jgi:hypothetical protein